MFDTVDVSENVSVLSRKEKENETHTGKTYGNSNAKKNSHYDAICIQHTFYFT